MSVMDGCEAKYTTPVPEDRVCPQCGEEVEVFTKKGRIVEDTPCPKCGYVFKLEPQPVPRPRER
jgi:rubredoxin